MFSGDFAKFEFEIFAYKKSYKTFIFSKCGACWSKDRRARPAKKKSGRNAPYAI